MIINIALDWLAKLSVIVSVIFVAKAYKQVYDVDQKLGQKTIEVAELEKEKLSLVDAKLSLEEEKLTLEENIKLMLEKEQAILSRVEALSEKEPQLQHENALLVTQGDLYEALSDNMSRTQEALKTGKHHYIDLSMYIEEFSFSFLSQAIISYISKMIATEKRFAEFDQREFNYKTQLRKHLEIVNSDADKFLPTRAYERVSEIALSTNSVGELMDKLGNTWTTHHNKTLNEIPLDVLLEDIANNEDSLDKLQTKNDEIMNALIELKSRL
ncbi:hypothetical protein [Pseudoalteromonas sp. MMG022]|uniref:hypothetical protein n=1 Tax=Pseudoalteromonas sp. MMG022 TaxID=2909978 RepID=UPI001F22A56B|nr:hypothetical protein [Pseudoalteromonas sp. MMG022]MCF6437097.1 hypothetical protein [Pseudoalteromonas sp. MMG022]